VSKLAPDGHPTDPAVLDTRLVLETRLIFETRLLLEFRTNCLDPRLVMGTRLLFETRLVLEVLRYAKHVNLNVSKLISLGLPVPQA